MSPHSEGEALPAELHPNGVPTSILQTTGVIMHSRSCWWIDACHAPISCKPSQHMCRHLNTSCYQQIGSCSGGMSSSKLLRYHIMLARWIDPCHSQSDAPPLHLPYTGRSEAAPAGSV